MVPSESYVKLIQSSRLRLLTLHSIASFPQGIMYDLMHPYLLDHSNKRMDATGQKKNDRIILSGKR